MIETRSANASFRVLLPLLGGKTDRADAMDFAKDGTVTFEEMINIMRGGRMPTPQGR